MKKLIILLAAITAAMQAGAQYRDSQSAVLDTLIWDYQKLNILLDTRIDLRYISDRDGDDAGFYGGGLKLWITGEIVPGVRYRVRQRFDKNQDPGRDNFSTATEFAYIAFDLGPRKAWTITAGRQSARIGTFENDYNSPDVYLSTMVNNEFDSYSTGVNTAWTVSGQRLNFQVVNSKHSQFASQRWKNKAVAFNLLWEGKLWDGAVNTRWAYSAYQHEKWRFYRWYTLGTQINAGKFTTELDWYFGDHNMDYGSVVYRDDLGLRLVRDQSLSLNFILNLGRWEPSVKGIWNRRHDRGFEADAYQNFGIEGLVEFYPFSNILLKDFRFHLEYNYLTTDYRGPWSGISGKGVHTVLLGLRWMFKAK